MAALRTKFTGWKDGKGALVKAKAKCQHWSMDWPHYDKCRLCGETIPPIKVKRV